MKFIVPPAKPLPIAIAPIPDIALESPAIAFWSELVKLGSTLGFIIGLIGLAAALFKAFCTSSVIFFKAPGSAFICNPFPIFETSIALAKAFWSFASELSSGRKCTRTVALLSLISTSFYFSFLSTFSPLVQLHILKKTQPYKYLHKPMSGI